MASTVHGCGSGRRGGRRRGGPRKIKIGSCMLRSHIVRIPGVESNCRDLYAGLKALEAAEDISKGEK